jgi:hypothetical protein
VGIDVILMLFSLAWICHSLKDDKKVMGNEKYMAIHTTLLLILLGSGILATESYNIMRRAFNGLDINSLNRDSTNQLLKNSIDSFTTYLQIYFILCSVVTLGMAYIMN